VNRSLLAGLDVGTTSVKAVVMTPDGAEVSSGRASTLWTTTPHGIEADPYAIADAAIQALQNALADVPGARVGSLGVASMAEAGILVGPDETPLAPVIAWHDSRDIQQLADLDASLGGQRFSLRTGLPLWTQWSLTKHRWLVDNVPSVARATRRYNVAEWVIRRLGGQPATELSLASRTGWLDLASGSPWEESLSWSGASSSLIRDLIPAGTPLGSVPADHPLNPIRGATLTVAGHDHQAAAIGAAAFGDNDELDSCGTAEALVRTIRPGLPDAAIAALTGAGVTVGWHAVAGRWCVLGATQGGLVLQQVMARLGVDRDGLADLDEAALAARDGATTLCWLGGPTDFTLTDSDSPGDVWRAATKAVTGKARELSDSISTSTGPRGSLVVTGGWSNSVGLMEAKATAMGTLTRSRAREAGARGAALLGGVAHGTYASLAETPAAPRAVFQATH
jgi:sugar (pentulose or hexulose) kinase